MLFINTKRKKIFTGTAFLMLVLLLSFSPILSGGTAKKAAAQDKYALYSIVSGKKFSASIVQYDDLAACDAAAKAKNFAVGDYSCETVAASALGLAKAGAVDQVKSTNGDAIKEYLNCDMDNLKGCLFYVLYWVFNALPQFILGLAAEVFNFIISITLSSKLFFQSSFITDGWTTVRDISNIFFIFILLYIAIRTIIGVGESENKKMIGTLIVVALLINFSMFFTKVVIDISNELALVFYNSIQVNSASHIPVSSGLKTGVQEKDLSGQLANGFKISQMVGSEFYEKAKEKVNTGSLANVAVNTALGAGIASLVPIPIISTGVGAAVGFSYGLVGYFFPSEEVSPGILLAIIIISGAVAAVAAYCFFVISFAFLSRLIMLWILIVFAPFAFLTSIIPAASKIEGFGWSKWWHDLISHAFMAPIFMFLLWLIIKLISSDPITKLADRVNFADQGFVESIILIIVPAGLVIVLLLKATKFAQKSSGELGGMIMKGAAFVGGAALGLATSGLALGANKYIGGWAARRAENPDLLKKASEGDHKAGRKLAMYKGIAKTDLNLGNIPGMGAVADFTGMKKPKFFSETAKGLEKMGIMDIRTEGGYKGTATRLKEKEEHHLEGYKLTGKAAEDRNTEEANWKYDKAQKWVDIQEKAKAAGITINAATKTAFEKAYDNGVKFDVVGKKDGKDKIVEPGVQGIKKAWTAERENKERANDFASSLEFGHQYIEDRNKARDAQNNLIAQYYKGVVEGTIDSTKVPAPRDFSEAAFRRVYEFDPEYVNKKAESKVKIYEANKTAIDTKNKAVANTFNYNEDDLSREFHESYTNSTAQIFSNGESHNWAKPSSADPKVNNNNTGTDIADQVKNHKNNFVAKENEAMKNDAAGNKRHDPRGFQEAFIKGTTYQQKGTTKTDMEGVSHPSQRKASSGEQMAATEIRRSAGEKDKPSASPAEKYALSRDIRLLTADLEEMNDNLLLLTRELSTGVNAVPGVVADQEPDIEIQKLMLKELKKQNAHDKTRKELAAMILSNSNSTATEKAAATTEYNNANRDLHIREPKTVLLSDYINKKDTITANLQKKNDEYYS